MIISQSLHITDPFAVLVPRPLVALLGMLRPKVRSGIIVIMI